ncbi:hypothetical protein KZZ08_17415 [Roseovarius mucosus]|uniref:Lipoprotein n=1 Tax=Roseovarius mucosus TaxID=215743 RepID=A0A1V0RT82_9RHOB|nr:hypothetical protein [Roseovarius mucosus]ARE84990.1 hypothetical protein ROSMUCSMR3_03536 [Roseovarius mucosus]MBW4975413.1 hypothetical protein [Roseovarius mucosus]
MKAPTMPAALIATFTLACFGCGPFFSVATPALAQSAASQQESYSDIQKRLKTQRQEHQMNEQRRLFKERQDRFCKEVDLRASLSISARQFGKMTVEQALEEYVGPSYAYNKGQRSVHEAIIWDAFSVPVAYQNGSVPSHVLSDFTDKWVGLCERGELGWP